MLTCKPCWRQTAPRFDTFPCTIPCVCVYVSEHVLRGVFFKRFPLPSIDLTIPNESADTGRAESRAHTRSGTRLGLRSNHVNLRSGGGDGLLPFCVAHRSGSGRFILTWPIMMSSVGPSSTPFPPFLFSTAIRSVIRTDAYVRPYRVWLTSICEIKNRHQKRANGEGRKLPFSKTAAADFKLTLCMFVEQYIHALFSAYLQDGAQRKRSS